MGLTRTLVATDDGIVAVDDDGTSTSLYDRAVTSLARDRDAWWAIAEQRVLLRREGDDWKPLTDDSTRLTTVYPHAGGAFVGTIDARLLRVYRDKAAPVTGFDDVAGRDEWHAVGSDTPYVRSISLMAEPQVILVNVHVGGIPRSGNGGASWKPTIDVDADVHRVLAHPNDPRRAVAAAAVGLAESTDAGVTWTVSTDGLHATYLRGVGFTSDAIVVSASNGPHGHQSALYRRSQDGGAFERVTQGLPEWLEGNVDSHCLDAHKARVVFADHRALYASDDGGATFREITTGLGYPHAVVIDGD